MRVPNDLEGNPTEALCGPSQPRTATLLTLPISGHHSVRSVAQEAYSTLWADEPDRAERWRRVGNMDQVYGVGRPLHTITKEVIQEVYREMVEMGMPGDAITQHLEDFACLMFWADAWGFVEWSRPTD
jgi:hypothetical protein